MDSPDSLGGAWFGSYGYGQSCSDVSFIALMEDFGGALSGTMTEPDSFQGTGGILEATFSGARSGPEIAFTKVYGRAGGGHSVHYAGVLSSDGKRIEGGWRLFGASGRFVMTREQPGAAVAETREEELERVD